MKKEKSKESKQIRPLPANSQDPESHTPRKPVWLYALLICAAISFTYHNSFHGPFILDGAHYIERDPSIREIWPLEDLVKSSSRPLTKITFALNYFIHDLDVFGYHLGNLIIHMLTALFLFGLIRRSLASPKCSYHSKTRVDLIAFTCALLWAVHPLQTGSVTYIFERAESLMGLCYLATLYSLARGLSNSDRKWFAASCLFCLAGMAAKAIMITAPIMALAYDRIFWARSWQEICKKRFWFYCSLAATWIALIAIALGPHESKQTVGFGIEEATPLQYAYIQPGAIAHYLRLTFWPYGLALDSGWPFAQKIIATPFPFVVVFFLLTLTAWALLKSPRVGFLGLWFFLILAPTSSFFPIADPIFEHRMYLSLAAVILAMVLLIENLVPCLVASPSARRLVFFALLATVFTFLSVRTIQRNYIYRTRYLMWQDVVTKRPGNLRGHEFFARILKRRGEKKRAIAQLKESLRLRSFETIEDRSGSAIDYYNEAVALARRNKRDKAIVFYRKTIEADPTLLEARNNLAIELAIKNKFQDAFFQLLLALQLDGNNPKVRDNMTDVTNCMNLSSNR